ncbi:MAG: hypothetical protein Q8O03_01400 [Nanoarchaeota archaeon]|nr:hypothetical protein [Nanoarchaeota archaeon]
MKIPEIFIPENNLENKVNDFLKPETVKKVTRKRHAAKNYVGGERKIWIYYKNNTELPSGGIYVHVRHPRSKNGCFLDIYSDCHFYTPPSDYYNPQHEDKASRVKAFCDNDTRLFKYLESLRRHNKGVFLWEDNEKLLELKKRKEKYEDQ